MSRAVVQQLPLSSGAEVELSARSVTFRVPAKTHMKLIFEASSIRR